MRGLASLVREERAQTLEQVWGPQWGETPGVGTWSGASVTNESAMQLLAVYGSARFIADGISTLPTDVFRDTGDERVEAPKPQWLEQPTADLDWIAWCVQVLISLLLAGNAYVHKQRSPVDGSLTALRPLDPGKVQVTREGGRKIMRVAGEPFTAFDVLHIPGLMFPGSDVGLAPVEMARQLIGSGLAAEETAARLFGQGMQLGGIIETEGDLPAEGPGSARELAKQFARLHSGKNKAHLPAVLVNSKWVPSAVTSEQAQFLQTRQFTAAQIAAFMFLIDPTEFGVSMDKGSSITYANLEQRNARKVTVTYLPWIVRIEKAISALLGQSYTMKLNVNGLLRGDTKTRYEGYKIGLDEDFLGLDEIRAWEDLPPLPSTPAPPPSLVEQIESAGALIRAGFDPAAALDAVGLPPIAHTGLVPVTVKQEDET